MRLPRNRASALPCDPPQTLVQIKNRHAAGERKQKLEPIDEAAGKKKTKRFSGRKIRTLMEDVSRRASIYSVGSSRASFGTSMLELLKGLDDVQFLADSITSSASRRRSSLFASMLGSGNESSLMHGMSASLEGSNLQKSEVSLSGSDRKGLYNGGVRYFTPYAQDSDSEDETTECTEEDEYETKEENTHDEESEIEESERSDLDLDSSLGSTVSEEEDEVYYYTQSGERVSRSTLQRNKAMEGRDQPKKKVLQRMKKSFLASLKV